VSAKLSVTQERALSRFKPGEALSAYRARESIATLRALVRKGYLLDVTGPGAGGMFSPSTHFQFALRKRFTSAPPSVEDGK
jgi:hypothetical protein